jgi:hypothetical protein
MTRKRTSENDMIVSAGAGSSPSRRKAGSRARAKHTPTTGETSTPAAQPEIAEPQAIAAEPVILAAPQAVADVTAYEPSRDEIAQQAYLYWEARGCQGGSCEEDWLRAEQELRLRGTVAL